MDNSDEKTLMESLDPVIVELLKENVRLRGEIDLLKERLDNKARLMIFQEGYIVLVMGTVHWVSTFRIRALSIKDLNGISESILDRFVFNIVHFLHKIFGNTRIYSISCKK